jgi:hypothetical protein
MYADNILAFLFISMIFFNVFLNIFIIVRGTLWDLRMHCKKKAYEKWFQTLSRFKKKTLLEYKEGDELFREE